MRESDELFTERYTKKFNFFNSRRVSVEIVLNPNPVEWTRPLEVETKPRFATTTPVKEANRSGMKILAAALDIVPTQTMLILPVL